MTVPSASSPAYVLDTNVLIHAVRGSATWQQIKAACDPLVVMPRPLVCVVTEGELRSFAQQRAWGAVNRMLTRLLIT